MTLVPPNLQSINKRILGSSLSLFVVVAVATMAASAVGLVFGFQPGVSLIRPQAGLALATIYLLGYRIWPAIFIGSLIVNFLTLESNFAPMGLALADLVEACVGVAILKWLNFSPRIDRVRDVLFLIIAAIVSTAIGAGIGTATLSLADVVSDQLPKAAIGWWLGGTISDFTIAALLLTMICGEPVHGRVKEQAALYAGLLAACFLAFGRPLPINAQSFPLSFIPFPFVMWAALRFGPHGAALASLFTMVAAVLGIVQTNDQTYQPLLVQYAFIAATSLTGLVTTAAIQERLLAQREREHSDERLHSVLSALPNVLLVFNEEYRYQKIFTSNEDLLVAKREEMIGKTLSEVLPQKDAEHGMQLIDKALSTNKPIDTEYSLEIDSVSRWFSGQVVPYTTSGLPRVLWVARDITDLVRAREGLAHDEFLLRNLLELQEKERRMLAYEIHDGLVQYMVGAQMTIEAVKMDLADAKSETLEQLEWSRNLVSKSIDEARILISELRPLIIDELGIVDAISYLVSDLQQKCDLEIDIDCDEIPRLPPLMEGNVFRVAQESLTNIRRHSNATKATVSLSIEGENLTLVVKDNGDGFDVGTTTSQSKTFGLEGIRKRAQLFDGFAEITSTIGKGTQIKVSLPTHEERPPKSSFERPSANDGNRPIIGS